MRVLHVIPAVAARYGGPSTAIWPMIAAIADQGVEVELATTDADGTRNRVSADEIKCSQRVHLFRCDDATFLKYSRGLERWLRSNVTRYDLLHVHSHWNFPASIACRVSRQHDVPYICRPCGMFSDYTWNKGRARRWLYWWFIERQNVAGAAAFHATSDGEKAEIGRLGVTAPIEVIPLGVSADAWSCPFDGQWLRNQCPGVFLSRLHPKKGLADVLLPAFAALRCDAHLAIAGGPDDHEPEYANLVVQTIARLGLAGRVHMLGEVRIEDRWRAYDGADLFVLPSHAENFGIVVIEAMARGKPVLVTDGVQSADHVRQASGGEVVPCDVTSLANALERWLTDPDRVISSGGSAREYARATFSWQSAGRRIVGLYSRIVRQ
ncbi:MAG: glycosyltransferase [Pirellulaceae bacterium]